MTALVSPASVTAVVAAHHSQIFFRPALLVMVTVEPAARNDVESSVDVADATALACADSLPPAAEAGTEPKAEIAAAVPTIAPTYQDIFFMGMQSFASRTQVRSGPGAEAPCGPSAGIRGDVCPRTTCPLWESICTQRVDYMTNSSKRDDIYELQERAGSLVGIPQGSTPEADP